MINMKKMYTCLLTILILCIGLYAQAVPVPPDGYILLPPIEYNAKKNMQYTNRIVKMCEVKWQNNTWHFGMELKKCQKGKWIEIGKQDFGDYIQAEKDTVYAVNLNSMFRKDFNSDEIDVIRQSFDKDFEFIFTGTIWELKNRESFSDTLVAISVLRKYHNYLSNSPYKNEQFAYDLLSGSGDLVINAYLGDSVEELIIPEEIEGIPVASIKNIRIRPDLTIKKLVIGSSVKEIADSVFRDMGIECLKFSDNSKIEKIGSYCFMDNKISELNLPKNKISIGLDAFSNNNFTRMIIYKDYSFFYKTVMGNFSLDDCQKQEENGIVKSDVLEEVVFEEGCISIPPRAFANCINLKRISIPVSMVQYGALAFYGCTSLSDISFAGVSLASVKDYDELAKKAKQEAYNSGIPGNYIMGEFSAQATKVIQILTDPYSCAWTFVGCPLSLKTKQLLMKIGLPEYAIKE